MTPAAQDKMSIEDEASAVFFRTQQGEWTPSEQQALEIRLSREPAFADAYRRVRRAWAALDTHAGSPQLLRRRQEAIAYARQVAGRRWLKTSRYGARWAAAAAIAGVALALAAWPLSTMWYHPDRYRTGIGEQRLIELDDHSRVALDAETSVQVRYSQDVRVIELKQGQAQFSVAKDPTRPFKVKVGERIIIALGTVFTVEFVNQQIHVAMLEGRVAYVPHSSFRAALVPRSVAPSNPPASSERKSPQEMRSHPSQLSQEYAMGMPQEGVIELSSGEALSVSQDGRAILTSKADLEAATAWREGKVIFRTEPLEQAVQRLNRYSRVQIEVVDSTLAREEISGVFEAGDTQGFVRDIQRYLPVVAESDGLERIRLRMRQR